MLLDLLSTDNYVSYNVTLAQLFGLNSAIYISEILNINAKAYKKHKLTGKNCFKLNRDFMTHRTTFTVTEQLQIESDLEKKALIFKSESDPDELYINVYSLTKLLESDEQELSKNLRPIDVTRKRTKTEAICENLKRGLNIENPELLQAYKDWVDSIYASKKYLTKKIVEVFQKTVDDFSNHNLDVALKIIEIATVHSYLDANWAISLFKKDCCSRFTISQKDSLESIQNEAELGGDIF